MAGQSWNPFDDLQKNLEELNENILLRNLQNVAQQVEKAISENSDSLSKTLGLEPLKTIATTPPTAPAPALAQPPAQPPAQQQSLRRSASAPAPAKTAPAQPPAQSQSLRRSSSAPAPAKSAQSLGRSASDSSTGSGKSSASSAKSDPAPKRSSSFPSFSSFSSFPSFLKSSSDTKNSSNLALNEVKTSTRRPSKARSLPSIFFSKSSNNEAPSRTPSRGSSKDDLRPEGRGNKSSLSLRASSGLSRCKSSLCSGVSFYLNYEVSRGGETIAKGQKKISSPSLPSFPSAPSSQRLRSGFSALRRGGSRLLGSLSERLNEASETIRETRKSSSSLRENWRDAKSFVGSFKGLGSGGFPSSSPSPKNWRNPLSGMSGVSSSYGADARAVLRESGEVFGQASSQAGEVLGDWARSVRQSASGWSASAWISR